MNMGTIIVGSVVLVIVGFAAFRLIKNIKSGKGGCHCSGCSGYCSEHSSDKDTHGSVSK